MAKLWAYCRQGVKYEYRMTLADFRSLRRALVWYMWVNGLNLRPGSIRISRKARTSPLDHWYIYGESIES